MLANLELLSADEIKAALHYFPNGLMALDIESTGLSPLTDKMIELSAIKIDENGKLFTFDELINPGIEIPPLTTEIHGITDQMVANSPSADKVVKRFLKFADNLSWVAHNAKFDIGFISFEIHSGKFDYPNADIYDSCQLSRKFFKEFNLFDKKPENHKLKTLSEFFSIKLENHHRALDDAKACFLIFVKLLNQLYKRQMPEHLKSAFNFNFKTLSKVSDYELPSIIKPLIPRILAQPYIAIEYRGKSGKPPTRILRPIGILPLPHAVVLRAQCLDTLMIKSYDLKRIKKLRFLDEREINEVEEKLKNKSLQENKENLNEDQ